MSEYIHPSFLLAQTLSEPLRSHFPKSVAEAKVWQPMTRQVALASRVLVVARTRVVCQWAAYCDAVPGLNHELEGSGVLDYGAKLPEATARVLFPMFDEVPYAH